MIVGTRVRIKSHNTYGSAFAIHIGKITQVTHDKRLGTYFTILFDGKVLTYPFYANEFEEVNNA